MIPTRDGDVLIQCYSDKPTPHRVTLITKDGEQTSEIYAIVLGRAEALRRAREMRGVNGTIFLREDDKWNRLED